MCKEKVRNELVQQPKGLELDIRGELPPCSTRMLRGIALTAYAQAAEPSAEYAELLLVWQWLLPVVTRDRKRNCSSSSRSTWTSLSETIAAELPVQQLL